MWDRRSGEPIYNAIVWQDRRTADACARLKADGAEDFVRARTGLLLDPYFSATKIAWILDNVADARARAERGELAFGTVDSFLIWRLTGGGVHATDATNASRTLLYDIHAGAWDDELLRLFGVPRSMLPKVQDTAGEFGAATRDIVGVAAPLLAVAGDQQAALIGQACFAPGAVKATFGTGGFLLLNTGAEAVASSQRLLTTIAYQWPGERAYALEGSIFSAGATVQWLRDGLGIIGAAAESNALAAAADPESGVYLVPAFAGLGAPHWRADARGALVGLTPRLHAQGDRARGAGERRLPDARPRRGDARRRRRRSAPRASSASTAAWRRATGRCNSSPTCSTRRSTARRSPRRPRSASAISPAGRPAFTRTPPDFAANWRLDRRFTPTMPAEMRERRYRGWRDAVAQALHIPGG